MTCNFSQASTSDLSLIKTQLAETWYRELKVRVRLGALKSEKTNWKACL